MNGVFGMRGYLTSRPYSERLFPLLLEVRRGDIMAQSDYRRKEKLEWLDQLGKIYEEVLRKKECVSIKDLAVSGRDLIQAGIEPGPLLGAVLERLVERVIDDPELNTKERLIALALKEKDDPSIFDEKAYFFEK